MLNRRGHIGTVLMVFGALILVITALFAFNRVGDSASSYRVNLRTLSQKSLEDNRYIQLAVKQIFNEAIRVSTGSPNFEADLKKQLSANSQEFSASGQDTNVFAKIVTGEYSLVNNEKEYTFLIKDLFYTTLSEDGLNKITKNFALKIKFDKEKVLSVETLAN